MKWFRTKSKDNSGSERTAQYVVLVYRRVQFFWVRCMQAWHQVIPLRLQRWGYGLFFILGFSFCALTVYRAVFIPAAPVFTIKASQQGNFIGRGENEKQLRPHIGVSDINRIKKIAAYFDSLQGSAGGKLKFDSMMRLRMGLADSLMRLKQIYQLP